MWLFDWPNEISLDKSTENYNVTIDVVSSGILAYISTGEVSNNGKLGSGFEVTPDVQNNEFTTNWSGIEGKTCTMDIIVSQDHLQQWITWSINQITVVLKFDITN